MRKRICLWLMTCLLLLLGGPVLTRYGVYHQNAMMVCLLQLMLANPLLMIATGLLTAKAFHQLWFLPLVATLLFLAGAWLFYAPGSRDFLWYTAAYLLLSYGAAGVHTCSTNEKPLRSRNLAAVFFAVN